MTIRVLHAADLHLGSPFALGSDARAPLDATLEAFTNVVNVALRERVDAVLLSGDLYERRDRSVRARFHLQKELERLHAAGIPSFIVHGNHDPLSGDPGGVELPASTTVFGAGWSEAGVMQGGQLRFRVQGISFQDAQVRENLSKHFRRVGPELTIGLLHCNVGSHSAHADYAPCTADDLDATGLDYWALGHVHTRQTLPLKSGGVAAYPGNTQGRQVNETGARGCLLVELDETRARPARVQFVACDVVRWHRIEVELNETSTLDGALAAIDEQVDQAVAAQASGGVKHHVLRVMLTGRTPLHRQLNAAAMVELEQALSLRWAERPCSLESLRSMTAAPFDLPRMVASGGLAGEIAKGLSQPHSPAALQSLWERSGIASLTSQLDAARIVLAAPGHDLLEQALFRALELITTEDTA